MRLYFSHTFRSFIWCAIAHASICQGMETGVGFVNERSTIYVYIFIIHVVYLLFTPNAGSISKNKNKNKIVLTENCSMFLWIRLATRCGNVAFFFIKIHEVAAETIELSWKFNSKIFLPQILFQLKSFHCLIDLWLMIIIYEMGAKHLAHRSIFELNYRKRQAL